MRIARWSVAVLRNLIPVARGFRNPIKLGYLSAIARTYTHHEPVILSDGTVVEQGDLIAEVGLVLRLPRLSGSPEGYLRHILYECFEDSLRTGAQMVLNDERLYNVKAILARSHLVGLLTERLGMETRTIRHPVTTLLAIAYARIGMLFVDPSTHGLKRALFGHIRTPREAWISKGKLLSTCTPSDSWEQDA